MLQQKQAAAEQNALNNKHGGGKRRRTRRRTRRRSRRHLRGGYQYKQLGGRIVVPQSDNAPPAAGPVDGNSLAVGGAENLTQNNENAKYDDVNAPAKVTTVAGGGRKKKKRKTKKGGRNMTPVYRDITSEYVKSNFDSMINQPIALKTNHFAAHRQVNYRNYPYYIKPLLSPDGGSIPYSESDGNVFYFSFTDFDHEQATKFKIDIRENEAVFMSSEDYLRPNGVEDLAPPILRRSGGSRKKKTGKRRKSRNGKKKSRRKTKRRNSKRLITGGRRRRSKGKGGYAAQLWGCFS